MRNYLAFAGTRVVLVRAASQREARAKACDLIEQASKHRPLVNGYASLRVRRASAAEVEQFRRVAAQAKAGVSSALV